MILCTLDERLIKGDISMQGNIENKDNNMVNHNHIWDFFFEKYKHKDGVLKSWVFTTSRSTSLGD